MKYDVQDCFHVSASDAETWKRAVAMPPEDGMLQNVAPVPHKKNLFGTLQSRTEY